MRVVWGFFSVPGHSTITSSQADKFEGHLIKSDFPLVFFLLTSLFQLMLMMLHHRYPMPRDTRVFHHDWEAQTTDSLQLISFFLFREMFYFF